jgi:fatty-acyl-CoA synthase/long-chain acyl-CoA synthetase
MLTLKRLVESSLNRHSRRVLMTYVDSVRGIRQEITYSEFDFMSLKFANSLRELGLRKGDKVAYLLLNRPETVTVNFASIRSGLVGVGINPILSQDDMEHIIRNSEAKAVVVDYWLQDFLRERYERMGIEYIIAAPYGETGKVYEEFINLYDLIEEGSNEELKVDVRPDDIAFLVYTGGTTGVPKGAIHTHQGMAMNMLAHVVEFDIRDGEKLLLVTPLVHAAGAIALASIIKGF